MAFVKAKREKVEIKICYAGCSGAGKSFSELKRLVKEEKENWENSLVLREQLES